MNLTSGQLTTLKTAINGDGTMSAFPNTNDGNADLAVYLNAVASPTFFVYRSSIPVQEIYDQITWANLTPNQAIPDSSATQQVQLAWQNRALMCQAKQFNLTILLQGNPFVNGSKASIRAGLQDALTNVPSHVDGSSTLAAGWVGVRDNALARSATRAEKILATGNGGTAQTAATMGAEGLITGQNVADARNS